MSVKNWLHTLLNSGQQQGEQESSLAEEAGLPDSWRPIDSAPINPSSFAGRPNPMANFFSGPISPTLQHDKVFVDTQLGTPAIAKLPLVPLSASGQPSVGSAVQSGSTTTINNTVNAVAGGPNGSIQFNNGGALAGNSLLTWDNINKVVNVGGSVNITGSLIITGNISATVFNATTGFQIGGAAASGKYLRGNGTDFVSATLSGTDVLAGLVGVTYGGTGADLSATGGTHEVLQQSTLGGAVTVGQLAYSDISGTPQLPQTIASVSHEWLNSYTASTGLFTQSQPAFTDISGLIAPSQTVSGSANLTAQAANVAATTLFSVGGSGAGLYRVSVYMVVSQAATVSSTLPDSRIIYTDQDSGATITIQATAGVTGNLLTTETEAEFVVNAKQSTVIQYDIGQTTPYASVGATPMQFAYRARIQYLG